MGTKYQIWEQHKYLKGLPLAEYYTIDTARDEVARLSKGKTHTQSVWNPKINPSNPWGSYEDLEVPDVFIIVEKSKLTTLRGFGIAGKFLPPKNCGRCKGFGTDTNTFGILCVACKGSGWTLR